MTHTKEELGRIIREICGYDRYVAEGLAARLAQVEDAELIAAIDCWAAGHGETPLVRQGLSTVDLQARGFSYPNAIACLNWPDITLRYLDCL